jgi:hypothetical protein
MSHTHRWIIWGLWIGLTAAVIAPGGGLAQEAPEERTIQGEIVDPAAYLKEGKRGSEMVDETYEALDGGQTLALLEDGTTALYLLLAEAPGEDPNELVYDYVNQPVSVTGVVYERGGLQGIVLTSAQPLNTPPAASAAAAP